MTYQNNYAGGYDYHRQNPGMFGDLGTRKMPAHSPMFGGQLSPFGPMGRSPFMGLGGMHPMMGGYAPQYQSPLGMGIGMGPGTGMGLGMGMGTRMGIPGRPLGVECSPVGYPPSSRFGLRTRMSPSAHPTFSRRNHGYSSWLSTQYSPFASSFLDDDDSDDEYGYDAPATYRMPRRRRGCFRRNRRPRYGGYLGTRGSFDIDADFYDGYDDFEDGDETDLDSFFPSNRRWNRY